MSFRGAAFAFLLVASQALAASGIEAMRANATGLRAEVAAIRSEQLSKRNELSVLSGRIETLKASSKDRLLRGSELDQALQQSQALSGTLTELAKRLSTREAELQSATVVLVDGLSAELNRLRAEFDRQTDRTARKALLAQMRQLRSERDSIRASLPSAQLPSVDTLTPTDDPEELLEQADLLRDNEEKVRRELKVLDGRIAQRREEADLDRQMRRFMSEESMFDDQDTRIRLQQKESVSGNAPSPSARGVGLDSTQAESANRSPTVPGPVTAGSAPLDPQRQNAFSGLSPAPQAFGAPPQRGAADEKSTGDVASGGLDSRGISISSSSDARPQVTRVPRAIATGDDDEMDDLDLQRLKLQGLAEQLKRKAEELEKKARQLR